MHNLMGEFIKFITFNIDNIVMKHPPLIKKISVFRWFHYTYFLLFHCYRGGLPSCGANYNGIHPNLDVTTDSAGRTYYIQKIKSTTLNLFIYPFYLNGK